MKRLSLQVGVAAIMFVVGAEFHQLVVRLTDVALRYNTVRFEEPAPSPADLSAAAESSLDRNVIVISRLLQRLTERMLQGARGIFRDTRDRFRHRAQVSRAHFARGHRTPLEFAGDAESRTCW